MELLVDGHVHILGSVEINKKNNDLSNNITFFLVDVQYHLKPKREREKEENISPKAIASLFAFQPRSDLSGCVSVYESHLRVQITS